MYDVEHHPNGLHLNVGLPNLHDHGKNIMVVDNNGTIRNAITIVIFMQFTFISFHTIFHVTHSSARQPPQQLHDNVHPFHNNVNPNIQHMEYNVK